MLLERLLAAGLDGVRVGVLEGDVQGSLDADRLASLHVPVTQINTDPGFGGECHLDANMSAPLSAPCRWTRSTCWSSRTSATSSARRSSTSARTPA
jgi:hypothetical protein